MEEFGQLREETNVSLRSKVETALAPILVTQLEHIRLLTLWAILLAGRGQFLNRNIMLFIHIPKTAGHSVASCGIKSLGHKRLRQHHGQNAPIMTVVRNPYDRAVSTYYYIKQCHEHGSCSTQEHDVNAWWSGVCQNAHRLLNSPRPHVYLDKQIEFINDHQGGGVSNRITHILRYEDLETDWPTFASKHNLKSLSHNNKSYLRPDTHWSEELNESTIASIGELYADDFENLGYERL